LTFICENLCSSVVKNAVRPLTFCLVAAMPRYG
jgi:hypothetical protein